MTSVRNILGELNQNGLIQTPDLSDAAKKPSRKPSAKGKGKSKSAASTTTTPTTTTPATAAPKATKKRKAETAAPEPTEPIEIDENDPRLETYRWSCNQVRDKIRKFLANKEMKVSEFQDAIDVSSKSYYDFMKQSGSMKGEFSSVYPSAHRFFAKRDLQGIKPKKKAKAAATGTGAAKNKQADAARYDFSALRLDGEDEEDVPVYDHCDEVRKKIRAFLRETGMSRAAFCREIGKTFLPARTLQGNTLASFLGKSGPREGSTSMIFYAAYVFFEKLRIRDGRPKTQFREEMEDVWGVDGFDRKTSPSQGYFCHVSSYIYTDEYGHVRCAKR